MAIGRVKWFNAKKGFGFLTGPDEDGDIFVHYSEIRVDGFRTLRTDEEVEYELYHDDKGAKARNVVPLSTKTVDLRADSNVST